MPTKCLIGWCSSKGSSAGISYYRLTKNRYGQWLKAIHRSYDEHISPKNIICSKHFSTEDFVIVNGKSKLKARAAPKLRKNVLKERHDLEDMSTETCSEQTAKKPVDDVNSENINFGTVCIGNETGQMQMNNTHIYLLYLCFIHYTVYNIILRTSESHSFVKKGHSMSDRKRTMNDTASSSCDSENLRGSPKRRCYERTALCVGREEGILYL